MAEHSDAFMDGRQLELTFREIAMLVNARFCASQSCLLNGRTRQSCDGERSAFVRIALHLVVLQRVGNRFGSAEEAVAHKRQATREVREELAGALGVDVNEVFRLHHHAAGLIAKDKSFRSKVRAIERELAEGHGIEL